MFRCQMLVIVMLELYGIEVFDRILLGLAIITLVGCIFLTLMPKTNKLAVSL